MPPNLYNYNDLCPVIVFCGKYTPKVSEGHHHLQGVSVHPEGGLQSCLSLLLQNPQSIPFCSSLADGSGRVVVVECLQGHNYVTVRATGMVKIIFLHNHYQVPHVALHRLNPEVGASCCPPPMLGYKVGKTIVNYLQIELYNFY